MHKPYLGGTPLDGTSLEIGFDERYTEVYLPPVGKVYNFFTGNIEPRPFINHRLRRSKFDKTSQEVFLRSYLPKEWSAWEKEEQQRRETDLAFLHPQAESFRLREWDRRINGCWMWLLGEPVYLTGLHYFHINWMKYDFGYPDFRLIDLEVFYLLQKALEDNNISGFVLSTRRRFGKTAIEMTFLLDYITRTRHAYGGLQSTTGKDAQDIWNKHILFAWRNLPGFFCPVYDYASQNKKDIWFKPPTPKGKPEPTVRQGGIRRDAGHPAAPEPLYSFLDYRDSGELAYDSNKLHRIVFEEPGKCIEANVLKRYEVVKPCLTDDWGYFIGKLFAGTTIEDASGGALENFVTLFEDSDYLRRDAQGRTKSGMIHHFIPAWKSYRIDKRTGINDDETAKKVLLAQLKKLEDEGDILKIAAWKRKYPFTWADAKMIGVEESLFPAEILNRRFTQIEAMRIKPYRTGNFEWENDVDGKVVFVDNPVGRWRVTYLPDAAQNNAVRESTSFWSGELIRTFHPEAEHLSVAGADPVDMGKKAVNKKRASKAASHVFLKPQAEDINKDMSEWTGYNFVCQYFARRDDPLDYFEDMIKQCRFWGNKILIEKNKQSILNHFEYRGYGAFLMKRPTATMNKQQRRKKFIYATEGLHTNDIMTGMYIEFLQMFTNLHGNRIPFEDLIRQLLIYDRNNPTIFDLVSSAGLTLAAASDILYRQQRTKATQEKKAPSVTDFLPRYNLR